MKKRIFLLGFISILLLAVSSCGQSENDDYLDIPNLKWGMTIDEAKDSLKIKEEDVEEEVSSVHTSISVKNYNGRVFGEQPSRIFLDFMDFGDGVPRLFWGIVQYDRETVDMNNVLKKMEEEYGNTVSSMTEYSTFNPLTTKGNEYVENTYEESDTIKLWKSVPMKELLSKEDYEAYRKSWGNPLNDPNHIDGFDDELWQSFLDHANAVTVFWSDDSDNPRISWNAYNYGIYAQVNESFKE